MSDRFCLRCDWQGSSPSATCPDCGARLYRSGDRPEGGRAPTRSEPSRETSRAPATSSVGPPTGVPRPSATRAEREPLEPSEPLEPGSRTRRIITFVVAALVLLVVLDTVLHGNTPDGRPASSTPVRLSGTLVYAVPDGRAWSRLWRWDLATDEIARGPRVPKAIDLVSVPGRNAEWVGVTSEAPSGRLKASILRTLDPRDDPTPVIAGDLVIWDPAGRSVAAVHSEPLRSDCRRHVTIRWAKLVPAIREVKYDDPSLCGDVLSLGLDDTATYFTLLRNGRVGIYLAGVHRIHPILPGHALVSMSAVSDMVVVPGSSLSGFVPLVIRPEQEHNDLPNASLFFRGQGAHLLTPYGSGDQHLAVDDVLAWSSDGLLALADGILGQQRGLFELTAGPSTGVREPTYIGRVEGIAYATFTSDGTPIVVTREGTFAILDHAMVPLTPPTDAPSPGGPIVWLR